MSLLDQRAFRIATRHIIEEDELKEAENMITNYLLNLPIGSPHEVKPILRNGGLVMDCVKHEVTLHGHKQLLTRKEYDLLKFFMARQGRVLSFKEILVGVWGPGYTDNMQALRVYTSELRDKFGADIIETVRAVGYIMKNRGEEHAHQSAS